MFKNRIQIHTIFFLISTFIGVLRHDSCAEFLKSGYSADKDFSPAIYDHPTYRVFHIETCFLEQL